MFSQLTSLFLLSLCLSVFTVSIQFVSLSLHTLIIAIVIILVTNIPASQDLTPPNFPCPCICCQIKSLVFNSFVLSLANSLVIPRCLYTQAQTPCLDLYSISWIFLPVVGSINILCQIKEFQCSVCLHLFPYPVSSQDYSDFLPLLSRLKFFFHEIFNHFSLIPLL